MSKLTSKPLSPGVKIAMALFVLLLGFFLAPQMGHSQNDPVPTDPRFGAVETYHSPELADEIGVGWSRILFYWSELEQTGPDDWNAFHAPLERIDREIAGGREIVGMLLHTPAWATDGTTGFGVPRGLYRPIDDPENVWAAFVRDVAGIYRGRVDSWVIWNEPDIPVTTYGSQWEGTTADYYQLVKVAYLAAHQVNPDVKIHLGGLTYWHAKNYLRDFLTIVSADATAVEHGYYFDVVTTHIYFQPDTTAEIVRSLRQTLVDFGLDRPIWIGETNAPPYDDPAHPWDKPLYPVTQQMQASFLLQEFALAMAEGVDRIAVYKWIDQPPPLPGYDVYGLLRDDGDPRPAFAAFKVIARHYAGAKSTLHVDQPEMHEVVMARGKDRTTRVMWARSSLPVVMLIPALAPAGIWVEQDGTETAATPTMGYYLFVLKGTTCMPGYGCFIGGPPLLLIEETSTNLPDGPAGQSFSVTTRTLFIAGMTGLALLVGTGLVGYRWRKRKGKSVLA